MLEKWKLLRYCKQAFLSLLWQIYFLCGRYLNENVSVFFVQPISDDFKRVIKEERRGKNLGDSILENKDLQNSSDNHDDSEEGSSEVPDLEDEIDSIEVIEEVIESFPSKPETSKTIPQSESERRIAELNAKVENQEKKLKNEKID